MKFKKGQVVSYQSKYVTMAGTIVDINSTNKDYDIKVGPDHVICNIPESKVLKVLK